MVGETYEVDLSLDVNVEIYRLRVGDKLQVLLASALDSEPDTGHYKPQRSSSLMDKFEYVVSGRVFKRNPTKDGKMYVLRRVVRVIRQSFLLSRFLSSSARSLLSSSPIPPSPSSPLLFPTSSPRCLYLTPAILIPAHPNLSCT